MSAPESWIPIFPSPVKNVSSDEVNNPESIRYNNEMIQKRRINLSLNPYFLINCIMLLLLLIILVIFVGYILLSRNNKHSKDDNEKDKKFLKNCLYIVTGIIFIVILFLCYLILCR
jgi:cell division protein FtsW (lipid II flippase)